MKFLNYFEGKNYSDLYHFVNDDTLDYLIGSDFNFLLRQNEQTNDPKKYFLSLTRRYDFPWTPFRITFTNLTNDFLIKPIHYHNREDIGDNTYDEDNRNNPDKYGEAFYNQQEERLFSNKKYLDLKKYIKQIDIMTSFEPTDFALPIYSDDFTQEDFKSLAKEIDKKGIKVNLVNKFSSTINPKLKRVKNWILE